MLPDMMSKLRKSLVKHEDERSFPYVDSLGNITIGIGYNLSARGLSDTWINNQFNEDVSYFYGCLSALPWFASLNEDRKIVIVDMSFIGIKKLLTFTEMIAALEKQDYEAAANEMLNSEWAKEVKGRATDLAQGMRLGVYNV